MITDRIRLHSVLLPLLTVRHINFRPKYTLQFILQSCQEHLSEGVMLHDRYMCYGVIALLAYSRWKAFLIRTNKSYNVIIL